MFSALKSLIADECSLVYLLSDISFCYYTRYYVLKRVLFLILCFNGTERVCVICSFSFYLYRFVSSLIEFLSMALSIRSCIMRNKIEVRFIHGASLQLFPMTIAFFFVL